MENVAEIEFFTTTDSINKFTAIGPARLLPPNRFSTASFATIQTWLSQCLSEHKSCNALSNSRKTSPSRLVKIGPAIPSDNGRLVIKLEEKTDYPSNVQYATLSHCWGDPTKLPKTELANYESQKHRIRWSSLTRTYKDAIKLTFRLGLTYLWIDSLCILQDSAQDWQAEAGRMAEVYRGAHITLAANATTANTDGLDITTTEQFQAHEVAVPVSSTSESPFASDAPVFVRQHFPHWHSSHWDMGHSYPLLARGWIYQERLLSPRVLHFGNMELLWECMEVTNCECAVDPVYDHDNKRWYAEALEPGNADTGSASSASPPDSDSHAAQTQANLAGFWAMAVSHYSKLSLTHTSDRLAAIAGFAKQLQRVRGGDYLAGLWEDTLLAGLLWNAQASTAPRPAKPCAPTWSWASVDGPVHYEPSEVGGVHAQVMDAGCRNDTRGGDPYVHVDWGYIVVASQMVPAQILYVRNKWGLGSRGSEFTLRVRDGGSHRSQDDGDGFVDFTGPDFLADYDLSAAGAARVRHGEQVVCLRLLEIPFRDVEASLVLRRVAGAKEQYERIGILFAPVERERKRGADEDAGKTPGLGHARIYDTEKLLDLVSVLLREEVEGPNSPFPGGKVRDLYANAGDAVVAILT